MRAFALLAARAALIAGPVVLAFFSGGFFDGPRDVALLVAGVVLAVAALAARQGVVPERPAARVALVAVTAYAGWIALSATWAPVSDFAGDDAERALLYAAVLAAAAIAFRERRAPPAPRPPPPAGAPLAPGPAAA